MTKNDGFQGSENQWESAGDLQRKGKQSGERKEQKKEGTYVKRAMWWRDKISYGRLLHLSNKSKISAPPELRWADKSRTVQLTQLTVSLKATKDKTATN